MTLKKEYVEKDYLKLPIVIYGSKIGQLYTTVYHSKNVQ